MYKLFIFLSLAFFAPASYGQVVFNITSSNITQSSITVDQTTNVYTAPAISLIPSINLKSDAGYLTGGVLPVSMFTAKIIGTAGNLLNVLSATQTVTLSTSAQNAYAQLLSVLQSGGINWRYSMQGWNAYALKAGTYSTGITFGTAGLFQGSLSPLTSTLMLNVSAFITQSTSVPGVQFRVSSLNAFRGSALSSVNDVTVISTVPYGLKIKASGGNFTFTDGYAGVTNVQTSTGKITAQVTTNSKSLQNVFQTLTPAAGINVPTGNSKVNTVTVAITAADLKAAFAAKGQYATTLNYEVFDQQESPQASSATFSFPLRVIIDELAELKVNQVDVNLNYSTAKDYAQGVTSDVANHLTLSSTVPYDVYVKAGSVNMLNGTQSIPVNVLDVTPVTPLQGTVNSINLSTTAQKIISGGSAVIDQPVNVRYAIPASRSQQLLNKATGSYSTTVTYSFMVP